MREPQYVVWYYLQEDTVSQPKIINGNEELYRVITDAHKHGKKPVIYRLGECLIDWS